MSADLSHTVPARYVPGGGAAWRDPWASYALLRDHDPVHHVVPPGRPGHDHPEYYVLSRHADVLAAAVDVETFSSARGLTVEYDELERIGLTDNPPFVMTDPPVHTTFRRLVARGFTPRQVGELEPLVRAFVVERVERLGAAPLGRVLGSATVAVDPQRFPLAPVPAVEKVLSRLGLTVGDIDLWEINEAFAVVAEKFIRDLELDRDKVNVNGGAMALGHPIGATGSILIGTMLDELERRDLKRGLVTMCAAGGMAPAIIVERI